jgi:SH3 domain-containing YSC84-like protein 1
MKKFFTTLVLFALVVTAARGTEQDIVDRSATIVREFRHIPEKGVPPSIIRHAKGLAILSVVKAGLIFSGKAGEGVVIARTAKGWSGPSFIGTGGAGWGLQIGAEVTDFVIVLNNEAAVRAFARGGNVTLGVDASVAAGPLGRTGEAGVTPKAAIYTYSKSKGLFAGVSLEGAVIATRTKANTNYYHHEVNAPDILHGRVASPPGAAVLQAAVAGR